MLAVNYSTVRNKLKYYCDKVTGENETIVITRKDNKNVLLISLEQYNALLKASGKPFPDMPAHLTERPARGKGAVAASGRVKAAEQDNPLVKDIVNG